jgi:hypothetical protein
VRARRKRSYANVMRFTACRHPLAPPSQTCARDRVAFALLSTIDYIFSARKPSLRPKLIEQDRERGDVCRAMVLRARRGPTAAGVRTNWPSQSAAPRGRGGGPEEPICPRARRSWRPRCRTLSTQGEEWTIAYLLGARGGVLSCGYARYARRVLTQVVAARFGLASPRSINLSAVRTLTSAVSIQSCTVISWSARSLADLPL